MTARDPHLAERPSPLPLPPDNGFRSAYRQETLQAFSNVLTNDRALAAIVEGLHEEENAWDLKRGEYYPEILRAVMMLRSVISRAIGVDTSQVHVNAGSNGSLDSLFTAAQIAEAKARDEWMERLLSALEQSSATGIPAKKIIDDAASSKPTFGVLATSPTYFRIYSGVAAKNLKLHLVRLRDDFTLDTARYIAAMRELKPRVAMLISPNNPTGIPIPDEELAFILDNIPVGTSVILDRTLVNIHPEVSSRSLLDKYHDIDLAILHSFSKYKGMSHLRIGVCLYSNPRFAGTIEPLLPLGVSLEGCIKAIQEVERDSGIVPDPTVVSRIRSSQVALDDFAKRNPRFRVTPFSGNYALVTLPEGLDSRIADRALAEHGLFVMPGHDFPEPDHHVVRIHAGGGGELVQRACAALGSLRPTTAPSQQPPSQQEARIGPC